MNGLALADICLNHVVERVFGYPCAGNAVRRLVRRCGRAVVSHRGRLRVDVGLVAARAGRGFNPSESGFTSACRGVRVTPELLCYFSPAWRCFTLLPQVYLVYPLRWSLLQRLQSVAQQHEAHLLILLVPAPVQECAPQGLAWGEFLFGVRCPSTAPLRSGRQVNGKGNRANSRTVDRAG